VNGTNGVHPPPDPRRLVDRFDFAAWRRMTELALAEGERRYGEAQDHLEAAQSALRQRLAELDVLRRALQLEPLVHRLGRPTPLGKGTRLDDGEGPGYRASRYLLEVALTRFRQSGVATFSTRIAVLACRGWPETTVSGGLRRLVKDGFVVRTGRGQYLLTELGQRQPPAAAGDLPLMVPREPEPVEASA
jgi:DNA-binding HxlR family transcriptional regulator